LSGVRKFKDHFRSSVVSRLDVLKHLLSSEAGASEIDDFDADMAVFSEHDVLWLQVAMDDIDIGHAEQRESY